MIKSLRTAAATLMTAVPALALTVLGPAGTVSAGVLDVTRTPPGSQNTTHSPPLTMAPQTVAAGVTAQYGPCVSLSNPAITSGTRNSTTSVPGSSCLELLNSGSVTYGITWNTGQTSTISANYTATIAGAALVVTMTGTVTSGLFAGGSVLQVLTGPATDVAPATAPTTSPGPCSEPATNASGPTSHATTARPNATTASWPHRYGDRRATAHRAHRRPQSGQ